MGYEESIRKWSKKARNRIGLCVLRNTEELREHLGIASEFCDVVCVGKEVEGFESHVTDCDENKTSRKLLELYKEGRINGFIRGHTKYSNFYEEFDRIFDFKGHLDCVCLMKNLDGTVYGIGPGLMGYQITWQDKLKYIEDVLPHIRKWIEKPKIGLTGKDFFEDSGYSDDVDKNIKETKKLMEELKKRGYDVEYHAHLINEACEKSDFVVAIDGTYGNYLYRTLLYMGGAEELGEIIPTDLPFTENSRYNDRYSHHLIFSNAVVNYNKEKGIEPKA